MRKYEATLTFKERVDTGLARNWKLALLILVLVVALMAAILVLDAFQENQRNDSAMLAEDIQEAFVEWLEEEESEDRDDEALNVLIDEALADYPQHFAAQKALFTRGLMALEQEEWIAAAENFRELVNRWEESYLAPVSLFNAGSALEQAGDLEGAEKTWTELVENYAEVAPDAPEALFNLGRLAEATDDVETAVERYGEIASRFPESRWTDLSKSRILAIESRL